MRYWFTWNGIDSRAMGLEINKLPPVVKPSERVTYTAIPGRSGDVSFKEGEQVYDGYKKALTVFLRRERDIAPVLDWLRGHGRAVFANEQTREYIADISNEISFDRINNSLYQAQVNFYVQPLKRQFPHEADITIKGETISLVNYGDVVALPKIEFSALTGSTGKLIINGQTWEFTDGGFSIDSDGEIVKDAGSITDVLEVLQDGFPKLVQGENLIGVYGFADGATITPRWRWV